MQVASLLPSHGPWIMNLLMMLYSSTSTLGSGISADMTPSIFSGCRVGFHSPGREVCVRGKGHASGILLCIRLQHVCRRCYHSAVLIQYHCIKFHKKDSRHQIRAVTAGLKFSPFKNSRAISIQSGLVVKVIKRLGLPK
jgi:hypothetical protein